MNLLNITAMALRILAVIALVIGIRTLVTALSFLWFDALSEAHTPLLISASIWILVAIILWLFARRLSRALTKGLEDSDTPVGTLSAKDLEVTLLTILGIYLLFYALVDVVYWISAAVWHSRSIREDLSFGITEKAAFSATIAEIAIATFIILRARGLSNLIHRLREAGHN